MSCAATVRHGSAFSYELPAMSYQPTVRQLPVGQFAGSLLG